MANWKEPKNDYVPESQVVPEIFNTLAENERYLQEKKITTEQVQDATIRSTESVNRENLGDSETVKGFFGKIRKWFSDLRSLAFKSTVGTDDIDSLAVSSTKLGSSSVTASKIASSAVTNTKIADGAVTTNKIADSTVTNAKISNVAASKVTGLHRVATSGSYNDLTDKPTISSGGGFNYKKIEFYSYSPPSSLDAGIYLAFALFTNAGSVPNVVSFGGVTYSPNVANGSYSNISSVIFDGEEMKVQLHISSNSGRPIFQILVSDNQRGCPYKQFDADGSFKIVLFKLSDLGEIKAESSAVTPPTPTKTWQLLTSDAYYINGSMDSNSTTVYIPGLKRGDIVKFTAFSVKLNENYNNPYYTYNTADGNAVYGYTYDGYSYNDFGEQTGWYRHQYDSESPSASEFTLSSETPYVGKVGLVDFSTANTFTMKVSCKADNQLTIEWSDRAGFYVEFMPIYDIYVKR